VLRTRPGAYAEGQRRSRGQLIHGEVAHSQELKCYFRVSKRSELGYAREEDPQALVPQPMLSELGAEEASSIHAEYPVPTPLKIGNTPARSVNLPRVPIERLLPEKSIGREDDYPLASNFLHEFKKLNALRTLKVLDHIECHDCIEAPCTESLFDAEEIQLLK
jgi:hypothetical protein